MGLQIAELKMYVSVAMVFHMLLLIAPTEGIHVPKMNCIGLQMKEVYGNVCLWSDSNWVSLALRYSMDFCCSMKHVYTNCEHHWHSNRQCNSQRYV